MNGWWIGLLVVLALFAGAGALAALQALLVSRHRRRMAALQDAGGPDSGAGPGSGPGPALDPDPGPGPWEGMGPGPETPGHHREPWYQAHRPPQQLPPWEGPPEPYPPEPYEDGRPHSHRRPRRAAADTTVDGVTGVPRAGRWVP